MKKNLLKIGLGLLLCFSASVKAQCLTANYGAYPEDLDFTNEICDGVTAEVIVDDAYTGEYSTVNVSLGQTYTFSSSINTDYITIGNQDGGVSYSSGVGSVVWEATTTGIVRFYTHDDDSCNDESADFRARMVTCGVPPVCQNAIATLPYTMGFEVGDDFPCIQIENLNGGETWFMFNGDESTASSGTRSIGYTYEEDQPGNDWFYTAGLNLVGGTEYEVKFSYKAASGPEYVENLEVKYGTAANATSMLTTPIVSYTNIATNMEDPFTISTTTFSPETTGVYYIGFHVNSLADQGGLLLDDISVAQTLSTGHFDTNTLSYYPNPVTSVLNLTHTKNISDLVVYNLLGQQVSVNNVNAAQGQADLSNLAAGTYIVKVTSEGATKMIKVIKQ